MAKPKRSYIRTGHGKGKGRPHVEVPRDSMPKPVPAPPALDAAPLVFRQNGQIADAATARALGAKGGEAKARRVRLIDSLGLAKIAEDAAFAPYRTAAEGFVEAHLAELAKLAGGIVSSGPSTIVASAALQLAASRFCFDKAAQSGDVNLLSIGSRLATDSRQNLLAAYAQAVLEAEGRPSDEDDPLYANGATP